jgi:alkylhydroperoxidase family enzyme
MSAVSFPFWRAAVKLVLAVLVAGCLAQPAFAAGAASVVPLADLESQARSRLSATPRVPLATETAEALRGIDSFETAGSGRVPNYLRAIAAVKPAAAKPFAHLLKTFVYSGNVSPALKLAMALRIAQVTRSPYSVAHVSRFLRATGAEGEGFFGKLRANQVDTLAPAERLALRWAELQTMDIHGMSDEEFRQLRGFYSDSEIVELTFTVCVFNQFTRLVEGLGLPTEPWVLDAKTTPAAPPAWARDRAPTRVALISDEEMEATARASAAARRAPAGGLGLGMLNAQRAMLRVPALAGAWNEFSAATGQSSVGREILLQVSFAVSMANGCRYCTMHQVVGLRQLGVDPTKLLAMEKDDSALTPREKTAVLFARKLTATPWATSDDDYSTLKKEFQDQGALEVLLQTCYFNFMNRFTDGLHLPSEDEAIKVYREIYGRDGLKPR